MYAVGVFHLRYFIIAISAFLFAACSAGSDQNDRERESTESVDESHEEMEVVVANHLEVPW